MGADGIDQLVAQGRSNMHVANAAGALIQALGETMDVSRVYVFRFYEKDGERYATQIREWAGPGIEPQIDNPAMQDARMADMGLERWGDVLADRKVISGPVSDLPADERPFLEEQGIQSIIIVPIEYEREVWGCVGFDDCNSVRQFSPEEVFSLRRAATLLAEVIELAQKHAFD